MHPSAEAAAAALSEAGFSGAVREMTGSTRTAAEAAATLGVPAGAIVNSLVFMADDEPVMVLWSGARRVPLDRLAEQLGLPALNRASPDQVRSATGQAIGGVSPAGHPSPLRTVIDAALGEHEMLWAAGGTPKAVFPTSYEELRRLCSATAV
ncbi:MAG: YbaK/EbsC family protein [Acidimicrobiales bacterium]